NAASHSWLAWYRLGREGQQTQGTIIRRDPGNHQTCYFEFSVGSNRYEGSDGGCRPEIGETVWITYSPREPSFATTASPTRVLTEQVLGAVTISCLSSLGIGWRLSTQRRASAKVGRPTRRCS